jgi:type IV pilus assembly protein PilC
VPGSLYSELALSPASDNYSGLGLNRDASRACMLADTLAWAVSRNIPLTEALQSLPFYVRLPGPSRTWRSRFGFLRDSFIPFRPFFWLMNLRWSWNIRLMIQDLEKGEPLSAALEKNLGRYFPGFYLMAIARAEAEDILETALPVLAHQLNYPAAVASKRKIELFFVVWKIIITVHVLIFVLVAVMPRFEEIFSDLLDMPAPSLKWSLVLFGASPDWAWSVASVAGMVFKTGILVIIALFILSRSEGIGEYVLLHIPGFGKERKRFLLCDLAMSMSAFLRQGEDIVAAAEWSLKATRSSWMRKRLEKFITSLRSGTRWVDAWDQMAISAPLDQWLVRNASLRQDPASGFELLGQWIHQEIEFTTRRMERWIDPCCTIGIAVIAGSLAYYTFMVLTSLTTALAQ